MGDSQTQASSPLRKGFDKYNSMSTALGQFATLQNNDANESAKKFGYKTFYSSQAYHIVRNKRDRSYERKLESNARDITSPEKHIATISIDKVKERPPIYRTDGSPNP